MGFLADSAIPGPTGGITHVEPISSNQPTVGKRIKSERETTQLCDGYFRILPEDSDRSPFLPYDGGMFEPRVFVLLWILRL